MSRGTVQEVKHEVQKMIQLFQNGRYFCAPVHCIEPETPLENIDAFVRSVSGSFPGEWVDI